MFFSKSMFRDALTALLVVTFGTSTWVSNGGLWVETPLLTSIGVPEGYKIGSYFIMVTQAAIIGPLIFATCQYFAPKDRHLEIPAICVTLAVGVTASFILIFFWNFHSIWSLDGSEHSTALLTLVFFMSLVDSTSNLTFLPFISSLKSKYLNWYFIGEGLSSVIPSIVVLIQGSGGDDKCVANHTFIDTTKDPVSNVTFTENCTTYMVQKTGHALFPPELYYTFIFLLFILSTISFCLLRCLPIIQEQYEDDFDVETSDETEDKTCFSCFKRCKRRRNNPEQISLLNFQSHRVKGTREERLNKVKTIAPSLFDNTNSEDSGVISEEHETDLSRKSDDDEANGSLTREVVQRDRDQTGSRILNEEGGVNDDPSTSKKSKSSFSKKHIFLFIILTVISSLIYGALPSIQSYSAGGYGSHTYLLVTAFAEISVPIGFVLVMIRPTTSILIVLLTCFTGILAGTYCMVVATLSPTPPLQGQIWGQILIILAWIFQGISFSYCRATIAWILRNDGGYRVSMMIFGGCTTLGTLIGAFVMFPLINVFELFEGFNPAQGCTDKVTCVMLGNETASLM
eukprot:XP_003731015.1 PREDICTED: solute carrier family 52, riboflavin transporter, member 3-B [Strongylocentrotus purpuratus]